MNDKLFVIIKDGYYWRPNGCGYTSNKIMAGFYTEKEAKKICEHVRSRCIYKDVSSIFDLKELDEMELRIKQVHQQLKLNENKI